MDRERRELERRTVDPEDEGSLQRLKAIERRLPKRTWGKVICQIESGENPGWRWAEVYVNCVCENLYPPSREKFEKLFEDYLKEISAPQKSWVQQRLAFNTASLPNDSQFIKCTALYLETIDPGDRASEIGQSLLDIVPFVAELEDYLKP